MCKNKYDDDVRTIVKLKNPGFTEINAKPDIKQQKNKGKRKCKKWLLILKKKKNKQYTVRRMNRQSQ